MHLHRGFGDAHLAGNLLVQPALRDLNQNRALTWRQSFESDPQRAQSLLILAASMAASEPSVYSIQKILVPERLRQKLDGAAFIACTVIGMSPCPVMKTIGSLTPAAARSR